MRATPRNVEAALDELGIDYTVRGNEASARCPNPRHHDRSPSWSCNLDTGMHNCFACGFGGGFARLVMVVQGIDWREAANWSGSFLKSAADIADRLRGGGRRVWEPPPVREPDMALFITPPKHELAKRRLTRDAAEVFGVLWDTERNGWVLPVRDPRTLQLRGWQLKTSELTKNHPYGLEKADCLFGYHLLRPEQTVILVESPLDAARMLAAGISGAVATYGANFSEKQILLLTDMRRRVVDAFDDDTAGHKASARLRKEYAHLFRDWYEFDYGDTGAKDPGDMTDDEIHRGMPRAR
jgi:Toprim-like/CHC2 zinc finger